jgi:hypothetical protein
LLTRENLIDVDEECYFRLLGTPLVKDESESKSRFELPWSIVSARNLIFGDLISFCYVVTVFAAMLSIIACEKWGLILFLVAASFKGDDALS